MRALLDRRGSLVPCSAAAVVDDSLWTFKMIGHGLDVRVFVAACVYRIFGLRATSASHCQSTKKDSEICEGNECVRLDHKRKTTVG
jgi:hypothetical protein